MPGWEGRNSAALAAGKSCSRAARRTKRVSLPAGSSSTPYVRVAATASRAARAEAFSLVTRAPLRTLGFGPKQAARRAAACSSWASCRQ